MISIVMGFAAGALHVLSGPDHMAAIAPIAAHSPGKAGWLGFRWGLGHGLGAVALGLVGVVARDAIDVEAVSEWAEFFVGFMLIGVGLWALRKARGMVVHVHGHSHDGAHHQHVHLHQAGVHHADEHRGHEHSHAGMYIGMLHGSAGSGHAFAVLPSLALPTASALAYLGAYFVAAVAAMSAFGAGLGWLARGRNPNLLRGVVYGSSLVAMAVGVFWVGTTWPL